MVIGWNFDNSTNNENDEGSNGATDSELVGDERKEIPSQYSKSIQVSLRTITLGCHIILMCSKQNSILIAVFMP